ncbi:histidine phosphatase family protein [Nocardioides montaniterrae]
MATVILVRHGRTTANASGILAGRLPGVRLDEAGEEQARQAGERLVGVPLAKVVSSPQERCKQTAKLLSLGLRVATERGIAECDYGEWQGRPLKELAQEALWKTVQRHPSHAAFPGGEAMTTMKHRALEAVRRHDAAVEAEHGSGAVWVAVSHGDIIKSVLADALGMHLDMFQRIQVDPASISIVRYTADRPYVLATNTHAGDLSWLAPRPRAAEADDPTDEPDAGAVVGGGAGPARS